MHIGATNEINPASNCKPRFTFYLRTKSENIPQIEIVTYLDFQVNNYLPSTSIDSYNSDNNNKKN